MCKATLSILIFKNQTLPRYQWYRAFIVENEEIVHEEVEGAGDSILELDSVAHEDAGGYCCKVYHIHNGKTSAQYSEWAYLTVIPTSGMF